MFLSQKKTEEPWKDGRDAGDGDCSSDSTGIYILFI